MKSDFIGFTQLILDFDKNLRIKKCKSQSQLTLFLKSFYFLNNSKLLPGISKCKNGLNESDLGFKLSARDDFDLLGFKILPSGLDTFSVQLITKTASIHQF